MPGDSFSSTKLYFSIERYFLTGQLLSHLTGPVFVHEAYLLHSDLGLKEIEATECCNLVIQINSILLHALRYFDFGGPTG